MSFSAKEKKYLESRMQTKVTLHLVVFYLSSSLLWNSSSVCLSIYYVFIVFHDLDSFGEHITVCFVGYLISLMIGIFWWGEILILIKYRLLGFLQLVPSVLSKKILPTPNCENIGFCLFISMYYDCSFYIFVRLWSISKQIFCVEWGGSFVFIHTYPFCLSTIS